MSTFGPTYESFHDAGTPVRFMENVGMWFVAGYRELRTAARAEDVFSSRHDLPTGCSPFRGVMIPPLPFRGIPLELDGVAGAEARRLLRPFFSLEGTAARADRMRELADDAIDRRAPSGRMDLFEDLAKVLPATIILEILGLPVDGAGEIADAVHVRGGKRFGSHPGWDVLARSVAATIARRREEPADDVVSLLLASELEGLPLDDARIADVCFTLVVGGMSTTAKLVLGSLVHLARSPADRRRLQEDPSLRHGALEELLRHISPVPLMARTAAEAVELGGCPIAPGDRVLLGFGAANRDPGVFEDPHRVVIDRSPNRHVAMGLGTHACLGASLGRLEASVMIDRVLDRLPDYELAEPPAQLGKLTVRPSSLPVTFARRPTG